MVHSFYRYYNDLNYYDKLFPYRNPPIYPDYRLAPIPLPLSYPQSFEIASYCSWPNSVQLVEIGEKEKYEQIKLANKENSCVDVCNSTFEHVIDSKKIMKENAASCICKLKSHEKKLEYVCA